MNHIEQEIDLRQLLIVLRKRRRLIVLIILVAITLSMIISLFVITPVYEATTEILVSKSETEDRFMLLNSQYIDANLKLIETYKVILQSPRILDKVANWPTIGYTSEELKGKMNISTVKNSQVIAISVQDPDQRKAVMIANAVARTFQREIVHIMNVDNVQVLTEAKVDPDAKPVKPRPVRNMALAFVLGLMVSVGLAFLLEYLDTTLKTEEDVERDLGLPVLGAIGVIEKRSDVRRRPVAQGNSAIAVRRAQWEVAATQQNRHRVGDGR